MFNRINFLFNSLTYIFSRLVIHIINTILKIIISTWPSKLNTFIQHTWSKPITAHCYITYNWYRSSYGDSKVAPSSGPILFTVSIAPPITPLPILPVLPYSLTVLTQMSHLIVHMLPLEHCSTLATPQLLAL